MKSHHLTMLRWGDKVRVRHINPFDEVMLECFDGALDWCNLGDLYLNFEHVNLV